MPIPSAVAMAMSDEESSVFDTWARPRRALVDHARRRGVSDEPGDRLLVGMARPTVTKWRTPISERHLDGLVDSASAGPAAPSAFPDTS